MVFPRAISNYIPPRPRIFSDEKNPPSRGYIVGYSPRKHHIYITYIYIYIILFHNSDINGCARVYQKKTTRKSKKKRLKKMKIMIHDFSSKSEKNKG